MQLRTDDFQFNGQKLSDFGFVVVNTGNSNNTRKIGLTRSLGTAEGVRGSKVVSEITETTQQITIIVSKLDNKGMPLGINDNDLEKLTTWLFSPTNYKELVALDEVAPIIYYGMFTDGEQTYLNKNNEGYITLTFELDSNHAYGEEVEYVKAVNGTVNFNIPFKDNVRNYYYPDIEFNVTGNSFTIKNTTMNETMEFTGLDSTCQHGIIYGDGIMTMISVTDNTVNLRGKSNKKFIRLQNGDNRIEITGNGTFTIKVQPKISLR